MTTLEDLYYGNIVPHEHSFKRGSAYSDVLSYVIRHQDSWYCQDLCAKLICRLRLNEVSRQ